MWERIAFLFKELKESNRRRLYRLALVSAIHINYAHQSGCDRFLCVLVDKAHFLANMSSAQLVYWSPPFEEVVGKMLMFWHLDYIKQCLTRCFSRPVHTQSWIELQGGHFSKYMVRCIVKLISYVRVNRPSCLSQRYWLISLWSCNK